MKTLYRMQLERVLFPLFEKLPIDCNVLDLGGGQNNPYKGMIHAKKYQVMDIDPHTKPDVVGDAHAIPVKNNTYDVILATEMLEHCYSPQLVVTEMHRILKKGGYSLGSVPFAYPYHGARGMKDYYRFSRDGLDYLFRDFSSVTIIPFGRLSTYIGTIIGSKFRFFKAINPVLEKAPSSGSYTGCVFLVKK